MTIGFGVIGCGAVGAWHCIAIQDAYNSPHIADKAQLIGVTDAFDASAQKYSERFGVPAFKTVEDMLACPDIHCVDICTPSGLHVDLAVKAAQAGKNVLIEKPMALTVEDCDRIIRAGDENRVKIGVVFQSRMHESARILKRIVNEGHLGKIITADVFMKYHRSPEYYLQGGWRGTWKMDGGGALMNQGIHSVDLLQWLAGPVKSVSAYARTLRHAIEVEDTVVSIVEFESGALGMIQATTAIHPGYPRRLSISGIDGTVTISDDSFVEWDIKDYPKPDEILLGKPADNGASDPMSFSTQGHQAHIEDMVDAIVNDHDPLVSAREGRKSVELIRAIYESSQQGKRIDF
ncbi:MAG: Gfo/Idh/MocA family protein [Eubacteriales bacterium]|jgi:UDP-N-acetyl-2-amino-2-deoxyglucuronate dehydrogenase